MKKIKVGTMKSGRRINKIKIKLVWAIHNVAFILSYFLSPKQILIIFFMFPVLIFHFLSVLIIPIAVKRNHGQVNRIK